MIHRGGKSYTSCSDVKHRELGHKAPERNNRQFYNSGKSLIKQRLFCNICHLGSLTFVLLYMYIHIYLADYFKQQTGRLKTYIKLIFLKEMIKSLKF